jgi:O-antigen/teichoic acid export membrane protein
MRHSTLLLFNTIASYARIIVNTIVTLIGTRIALRYLGADDFGLYNLIAGIVVLLSFINGALLISSQRFFSIAIGEKNNEKLCRYFNASLGIHIVVGVLIGLVLLIITPLLFNGFLNIAPEKISLAKIVYYIMIASATITIATIPFSAIMNAREDLVVLSVCDIVACILRLFAAICLVFINNHLLLTYTILMLFAILVKMVMEMGWTRVRYQEAKIVSQQLVDKTIYNEMLGFIGWNTLGSLAVLVRNQGVAVILNVFFGTVINAAYGIANQVNSLVLSFASTLTTVFAPTIIQAKGANDDKRMINTAIFSSKLSFYLSSAMALPILLFLPEILHVWLGAYPDNTLEFCLYIVLSFLVLQLYPGINRAIYATGQIKGYQISISILLVVILPIGVWLFRIGYPPYSILFVMLISQTMILLSTLYYAKKLFGLCVKDFLLYSIMYPVILFCFSYLVCDALNQFFNFHFGIIGIIIYTLVVEFIYTMLYVSITFNHREKQMIYGFINRIKNNYRNLRK